MARGPYPCRGWRKARILIGVVASFVYLTIPGWASLRSYRRWRDGESQKPGLLLRIWSWGVVVTFVVTVPLIVWLSFMRPSPFRVPKSIYGVPLIPGRASELFTRVGSPPYPAGSLYEAYGYSSGPMYVVVALREPSSASERLGEELKGMQGVTTPEPASRVERTTAGGQHIACEVVDLVGTTGKDILCGWDDPTLGTSGSVVAFAAPLETTVAFTVAAVAAIHAGG
ncbi:MAG: hypothetical protein HY240_10695 [Actinobacteria bacterium]|nr:hypothetical protein [Actinomycetota bacterium]